MKTVKGLIGIFVVVALVYTCLKVVPVYFDYYQFQDAIESEARIQSYSQKSENDMRESIWKKAKELELPLTSQEQIKVERSGAVITISTEYTVHIDLPVHPFDLEFKPSTRNKQI
jgi:uncharacterized protein DUF4845